MKLILITNLRASLPKLMMPSPKITSRSAENIHESQYYPQILILTGNLLTLSYLLWPILFQRSLGKGRQRSVPIACKILYIGNIEANYFFPTL